MAFIVVFFINTLFQITIPYRKCAACTTLYEFIFLKVVHLKALILLGFLRVILICTTCTTKIHPYI